MRKYSSATICALLAIMVTAPVQARDMEEMLKKPIKDDVMSPMTVDELENCLQMKNNGYHLTVVNDGGSKRLGYMIDWWLSFVITLTPTNDGTRITRQGQTIGRRSIQDCVPLAPS